MLVFGFLHELLVQILCVKLSCLVVCFLYGFPNDFVINHQAALKIFFDIRKQVLLSLTCLAIVAQSLIKFPCRLVEERAKFPNSKLEVKLVCCVGLGRIIVVAPLVLEVSWHVKKLG